MRSATRGCGRHPSEPDGAPTIYAAPTPLPTSPTRRTPIASTFFTTIDWDAPGKQLGTLNLPHSPDDDAWGVIPHAAASIRHGDGPVVIVSGGVHGDEYEGPVVIAELMRDLQPTDVQGQLILLPGFNGPAQRAGLRTSPIDRLNLNRVFPGDDYGLPTQQIARYVTDTLFPRVQAYIDLHAGGRTLFIEPSAHVVMSPDMPPDLARANAAMATAFGVPITVQTSNMGDYRTAVGCATQRGIPTLSAEMGMGGWMSGPSVEATRQALRRVLKHLGVLPHATVQPGAPTRWTRIAGPSAYLFAPFDGYFERHFQLGDAIAPGQFAGWMHLLDQPQRPPEALHFTQGGRLYAHGLVSRVRAGQNLAVLIEDVNIP